VGRTLRGLPPGSEVAISVLTLYELTYGFLRNPAHSRLLSILGEERVAIVPPPEAGAMVFAVLKRAYRGRTGAREKVIGRHNIDLILASTAIAGSAVLVSNDRIFRTLAEVEPRLDLMSPAGDGVARL
jgi:predicted nucleic acid-binding protein